MSAAAPPPDLAPGLDRLARHVTASGLAGIATGLLVGGIGGRLFMRAAGAVAPPSAQGAATEAGNRVGEITLGGSLGLVIFIGIFTGAIGAFLFVVFRPWLTWAGRWQGPVFGVLLFAVGSATSDMLNPDNRDFAILGNGTLLVAMIFALFVVYGWLQYRLFDAVDRRLPYLRPGRNLLRVVYYWVTVSGLLLAVLLVPQAMFTRETCDCDPPRAVGLFVVVTAVGTAVVWLASRRWTQTAAYLGVGGAIGAGALGLGRAIADALEILG